MFPASSGAEGLGGEGKSLAISVVSSEGSSSALSGPAAPPSRHPHLERKLYLYSRNGKGYTFLDVYNFIRDRLRACWQHLTVQHAQKHRAYIETLEISFRFLVFAEEQLCGNPSFDRVSNQGLLQTCLDKLMHGYEAVRAFLSRKDINLIATKCLEEEHDAEGNGAEERGRGEGSTQAGWTLMDTVVWRSRYEGEFWGYRILCLLSSHGGSGTGVLSGVLQRLPPDLLGHRNVRFALEAFKAFAGGNIRRYVHLMRSSGDYLSSALMNKFANYVRATTLNMLVSNRLVNDARNPMTVERMKFLLGFDGETGKTSSPTASPSSRQLSTHSLNLTSCLCLSVRVSLLSVYLCMYLAVYVPVSACLHPYPLFHSC